MKEPKLRLAWFTAGLPLGLVEIIDIMKDEDLIPNKTKDYLCIVHEPGYGACLVVCTKLDNTLYVISDRNLNVLFE